MPPRRVNKPGKRQYDTIRSNEASAAESENQRVFAEQRDRIHAPNKQLGRSGSPRGESRHSFAQKRTTLIKDSNSNANDHGMIPEGDFEQGLTDGDFLGLCPSAPKACEIEEVDFMGGLNDDDFLDLCPSTPRASNPAAEDFTEGLNSDDLLCAEKALDPYTNAPFCPLRPLADDTYVCPFKKGGGCKKSTTFRNLQAVAAHVDNKHKGLVLIPFEESVIPDGTKKIPCRKGCQKKFATYSAETFHAKSCKSSVAGQYPRPCQWPGCVEPPMTDAKAYATHNGADYHTTDSSGLYQCYKCKKHFYDIYLLGSHDTRCEGLDTVGRANACRVYQLSDSSEPPCVLVIARSSGAAPSSWYSDEEFLSDGLPIFGRAKLDTLLSDHASLFTRIPAASFYALYDVHTRCVPTGLSSQAKTTDDPSTRSFFTRARQFTLAIDAELARMHQQGDPVYLVSIGIDGFGCEASLILPWLKRSPRFTFVIRETELCWGMDERHFPKAASGLYWGFFDTRDIVAALENGTTDGEAVNNLIAAWNACQSWKNDSPANNGRKIGRNGEHAQPRKKAKRGAKKQASSSTLTG